MIKEQAPKKDFWLKKKTEGNKQEINKYIVPGNMAANNLFPQQVLPIIWRICIKCFVIFS